MIIYISLSTPMVVLLLYLLYSNLNWITHTLNKTNCENTLSTTVPQKSDVSQIQYLRCDFQILLFVTLISNLPSPKPLILLINTAMFASIHGSVNCLLLNFEILRNHRVLSLIIHETVY